MPDTSGNPYYRKVGNRLVRVRKPEIGGFRRFILSITAFGLGMLCLVVLIDRVFMPLYLNSGREIIAPDLINKTRAEALRISRAYELTLVEDGHDFSNTAPAETITMQIPSPGTILKPGRRMHVVISKGPRPLMIPNVVGKSPVQAELEIKSAGLEVIDKRWKASDKYPRGIVAEQYPPGDQEVPENTGVILFVANGRKETNVVMPNLIDLSYQAALDTLSVYKFNLDKVIVQKEEAPQLLPDTVIDQHPDPGVPTNTNIEIDLVVSTAQ